MRILILAAIALAAAPAAAQDRAAFTGARAEAVAGYDHADGDDAAVYGTGAGYDFALSPSLRAGLEAEITGSSLGDCVSGAIRAGDRLCTDAGRDLYVGGRIGTLVGASTLLYAKAGYTNARGRVRYISGLPTGSFTASDHADGVRVGAGVEHRLAANLYAKAEYRYSNYEAGGERHQLVGGMGIRF